MKTIVVAACGAALIFTASIGLAQNMPVYVKCESCGRVIGRDVPETPLSSDPDFKKNGMFQVCQQCLDKKMDKQAQATYVQVARKYKWNSIAHNKSLAFKPFPRQRP